MVLMTDYDAPISLMGISCQQYIYAHSNFLSSLVPNLHDAQLVADIKNEYFRSYLMVGIHYRSHDDVQDWEVVPPFDDTKSARKFGDGATFDVFEQVMASMTSYFSNRSESGVNSLRFFVASNLDDAKERLLQNFPNSISLRGGDYARHTREGIHFALVEWLLLSECALIINTYGSSFAVEVNKVNKKKREEKNVANMTPYHLMSHILSSRLHRGI